MNVSYDAKMQDARDKSQNIVQLSYYYLTIDQLSK